MSGIVILSAFILDLIFGDPPRLPHPVRGIGWLIQKGEYLLKRTAGSPRVEKTGGVVLVIFIISAVYFLSQFLVLAAFRMSPSIGFLISALIAYTTLAARDLADSARRVLVRLNAGDTAGARRELSMIVGRDTGTLDEHDIARAVVETVAENAADGVIAPLFYLAIGGPALAMAYKAVNTMDSMIGYKNEKYMNFGWAAARLDDVANYIPARITGVLICSASGILRKLKPAATFVQSLFASHSEFRTQNSELYGPWRIMLRDGRNHPSPNSGYPEAAMAGALGVRLGGPSTYGGVLSVKPYIGEEGELPDKKSIEKSIRLMYCATSSAVAAACATAAVVKW